LNVIVLRYFAIILATLCALPGAAIAALSWSSSGPGGGGALASPSVSVNGSVIVASDLGGVYRSTDGGANWSAIGNNKGLQSTHVDALAHHPTIDGTVFLGAEGGIYRSTNCDTSAGACTFTKPALPGATSSTLVTAFGVASSGTATNTTVYAAGIDGWCNDGPHLWKSTNTGATWTAVAASGLPANANIMAIRVQSGTPNTIIAVSAASRFTGPDNCQSGFQVDAPNRAFISTNGGVSFNPVWISVTNPDLQQTDSVTPGDTWGYVADIKFDKVNANKLWATITANPSKNPNNYWNIDGELWSSIDLGANFVWQSGAQTGQIWPLSTGNVRVIDLRRQRPWWTSLKGVWEWNAGTAIWSHVTTNTDYNNWTLGWSGQAVAPQGSINGGLHTFTPANDNVLWWVDDQFAFKTTNGGHTFLQQFDNPTAPPVQHVSRKLDNAVPAVLAASPVSPGTMHAGYFDMGCWRTDNATGTTPSWIDCNGPKTTAAPWNLSPYNGNWYGFGGNTTGLAPDPWVSGQWWEVQAPSNASTDTYKVLKLVNNGAAYPNDWTDVTLNLPTLTGGKAISDLAVSAPNTASARRIWAIANNQLFRLVDGQASWSQVTPSSCNGGLMVVEVKGARILTGGAAGVCASGDNGVTWTYWSPGFWFGTPSLTWWRGDQHFGVSDFAFDPVSSQIAWMTVSYPSWTTNFPSTAGLYRTSDGGATWVQRTEFGPNPFERNFARTVAVSPANGSKIVVGTSSAVLAGGYKTGVNMGAWVSVNGGQTWSLENTGLAWPFITKLRFTTSGTTPLLYGVSPGQGIVYSASP
jgi:hypothetical protein